MKNRPEYHEYGMCSPREAGLSYFSSHVRHTATVYLSLLRYKTFNVIGWDACNRERRTKGNRENRGAFCSSRMMSRCGRGSCIS